MPKTYGSGNQKGLAERRGYGGFKKTLASQSDASFPPRLELIVAGDLKSSARNWCLLEPLAKDSGQHDAPQKSFGLAGLERGLSDLKRMSRGRAPNSIRWLGDLANHMPAMA